MRKWLISWKLFMENDFIDLQKSFGVTTTYTHNNSTRFVRCIRSTMIYYSFYWSRNFRQMVLLRQNNNNNFADVFVVAAIFHSIV